MKSEQKQIKLNKLRIFIISSTGQEIQHLDFPTVGVTCPSFGGKDLDEMYVTTTRMFQSPEQLQEAPLAGCVFRVTGLGVKGKHAHKFAG